MQNIKQFISKYRKYRYHMIVFVVSIFLVVVFIAATSNNVPINQDEEPNDDPIIEEPIEEPITRSLFNGAEYDQEQYQPFSVLIENSLAARPQSGLGLADIVYEVSVEGFSMTRFLAIFHSQTPNKIGPIRSVRMPFAIIAKEWMIPFAHYGGAKRPEADAYGVVRDAGFPVRLDGVSGLNNQFFFRDSARKMPHNAYLKGEDALSIISPQTVQPHFDFDELSNVIGETKSTLSLKYASGSTIRYDYDQNLKTYLRFMGNQPFMDSYTNQQITVKNIILQYAKHTTAGTAGYVLVEDVGRGDAEFFIEGQYHKGYWEKKDAQDITRFYLSNGDNVVLTPGNTWIQLISHRVIVSYE